MNDTVRLSDIYDLIDKLSKQESQYYNNYMNNNPLDTERTRDHILAQAIYCQILQALNAMNKRKKV